MTGGETEPRTESESAMACQCGACGGTGKCATCVGSGRAERTELVNARRTRRHRFDTPDPPPCGIWRYQGLPPAKRKARPVTDGEKIAGPDLEHANPECAAEKIWPCAADCWRPCAQCGKLVCEKHDYLVPVWPPENDRCDPADMVCKDCLAGLWYRDDISQSTRVQYLF